MTKHKPIVIGLTGSIGMGKSTVARMFIKLGAAHFDADACVRSLLSEDDKTHHFFETNYPSVFYKGRISRIRVGRLIFSSETKRKKIEAFLHPIVKKEAKRFIEKQKESDAIILDIPLLYESKIDGLCDITCCASAAPEDQKTRVMKRGRLDEKQLEVILKRQLSDKTKRRRSDVVFDTSVDKKETRQMVEAFYKERIENA